MPLTAKQKRQKKHIEATYKKKGYSKSKGEGVFYAMEKKGKITGSKKGGYKKGKIKHASRQSRG